MVSIGKASTQRLGASNHVQIKDRTRDGSTRAETGHVSSTRIACYGFGGVPWLEPLHPVVHESYTFSAHMQSGSMTLSSGTASGTQCRERSSII